MKKKNLIILAAFLLIFETFLVSGVIVDNNLSISADRNSFDVSSFDSEGRSIVYPKQESSFNQFDYSGYIIEFEKPSLTEREAELEKIAEKNKGLFLTEIPIIKEFFVTYDNLDSKVQGYEKELDIEHEKVKNKIFEKTTSITLNEYKLVFNGIALNISDAEAREIEKIDGVKKAWPNMKVQALLIDSVPLIGADEVWKFDEDLNICYESGKECLTGKGIKIAIIDTGVDYTHPDLGGCLGQNCKVIGGYDIVNHDTDPMDDYGHGTHVAAIAAGNGILSSVPPPVKMKTIPVVRAIKGVAPDAQILAYKVLDSGGSGSWSSVIEGIERAVLDDADIISMSLGGGGNPDDPVSQATNNAVEAGIVAVVAAGNSGPSENSIGSPGTARKAITVGATDKQDNLAWFSSKGSVIWEDENEYVNYLIKPDIVAPGVYICAAQWNGWLNDRHCLDEEHISISGTSMATPHVAGAVALLKQKNPDWTPNEIKMALRNTTIDLNYGIIEQGRGRIDVVKAVELKDRLPITELSAKIENNKIKLFGTAYSNNFSYFKIYRSYEEEDFEEIYYSTSPIDNGLLYEIDLRQLKDGKNTFRLDAISQNGKTSSDFVLIDVENIKIKSLFTNDIYRKGDLVKIKASILYNTYNYTIYWSKQYEDVWSSEGIALLDVGDLIAEWDTSFIKDGFYKIKIVFDVPDVGTFEKRIEKIYFDSTLKKGWPQRVDWEYACESRGNSETLLLTSQDKKVAFMTLPKDRGSYVVNGLNNELILINNNKLMNYNDRYSLVSNEGVSSLSDFCYYYWGGFLEPIVEDINNDGDKEIIVYKGGGPPKILVYRQDGSLLWEREVGTEGMGGGNLHIPLVGDLTGDGNKEIIAFNFGDFRLGENQSQIYAFRHDGSLLWSVYIPSHSMISMLMADLNNDGNKEIVIKGNDAWERKIMIINSQGEIVSLWNINKKSWGGGIEGSPAIGNFDNDNDVEIVVADPSENAGYNEAIGEWINEGIITVYNMDGIIVEGWPKYTNGVIFSSPVVGDIDNDGYDDIIIGLFAGANAPVPDLPNGGVYAFDRNGNILLGWPYEQGYNFWSTPALGDVNNDGNLEISVSKLGFETSLLYHDGNIVNGWPRYTAWNSYYSDILADVTGDGQLNVLTTAGSIYSCDDYGNNCGGVYAWDLDGNLVSEFPKVTEVDAQAPLAVFENNGVVNIVSSSDWDTTKRDFKFRGSIYVWELNAPYNPDKMDWPMFMHDAQHTGCYKCDEIYVPPVVEGLSKITNNENMTINGQLSMFIQRKDGINWNDYLNVVLNESVVIPAKSSFDSRNLFNSKNVAINEQGNYRVYGVFEFNGERIESSEEFSVLGK